MRVKIVFEHVGLNIALSALLFFQKVEPETKCKISTKMRSNFYNCRGLMIEIAALSIMFYQRLVKLN